MSYWLLGCLCVWKIISGRIRVSKIAQLSDPDRTIKSHHRRRAADTICVSWVLLLRKSKRIFLYSLSAQLARWLTPGEFVGHLSTQTPNILLTLRAQFLASFNRASCKKVCALLTHSGNPIPRERHLWQWHFLDMLSTPRTDEKGSSLVYLKFIRKRDVDKHTCQHDEALVLF